MINENSIGRKKSNFKSFLVTFFVIATSGVFGSYAFAAYDNSNSRNNFINELYRMADEAKKALPIKGDEFTTIEDINFDGSTITYSSRIHMLSRDIDEGSLKSTVDGNFKAACKNPNMTVLLNKHITYSYNYYDINGTRLGEFKLTKDVCRNL